MPYGTTLRSFCHISMKNSGHGKCVQQECKHKALPNHTASLLMTIWSPWIKWELLAKRRDGREIISPMSAPSPSRLRLRQRRIPCLAVVAAVHDSDHHGLIGEREPTWIVDSIGGSCNTMHCDASRQRSSHSRPCAGDADPAIGKSGYGPEAARRRESGREGKKCFFYRRGWRVARGCYRRKRRKGNSRNEVRYSHCFPLYSRVLYPQNLNTKDTTVEIHAHTHPCTHVFRLLP
jgi:hypothetical protein